MCPSASTQMAFSRFSCHVMGLRYNNAEGCKKFQQSKRFSAWSWSDTGRKEMYDVLSTASQRWNYWKMMENVSFGSDPDGSELQTALLPSNRLWSHGSTYERLGLNYSMLHIAWECQSECSQNKHMHESKHCSLNSSTISNTHEAT